MSVVVVEEVRVHADEPALVRAPDVHAPVAQEGRDPGWLARGHDHEPRAQRGIGRRDDAQAAGARGQP